MSLCQANVHFRMSTIKKQLQNDISMLNNTSKENIEELNYMRKEIINELNERFDELVHISYIKINEKKQILLSQINEVKLYATSSADAPLNQQKTNINDYIINNKSTLPSTVNIEYNKKKK
eukprot:473169_1